MQHGIEIKCNGMKNRNEWTCNKINQNKSLGVSKNKLLLYHQNNNNE